MRLFLALAGFQNSDFFQKAIINKYVEMHFECDFAPIRIQTSTQSHPC